MAPRRGNRKPSENERHPNPIRIEKFLGGVDYPASREALISQAKDSGADDNVLRALESIPDREYDGPTAVSAAVSEAAS